MSCSLKEYFELYKKRQKELLRYFPKYTGTDYGYTVYMAWRVSLDKIESMQDAASNHALELLNILCFYHHDQVPVKMLYNAWHNSKEDPLALDSLFWPEAFSDFLEYQQSVRASVTLLASFSLITRDSDASLSFHPLVHDWCRDRMSEVDQQSSRRRAVSLLARSVDWEEQERRAREEQESLAREEQERFTERARLAEQEKQERERQDQQRQEWERLERERLAKEQERLVKEQERLVKEQERLVKEQERLVKEQERLVKEQERLVKEQERLVKEQERLVKEQERLVKEQERLVKEQERLVKEQERLVKEQERRAMEGESKQIKA
ncbi:hypothetical protein GJ744_007628 [Endocarpon pusillum]|uniref:DUF7779 domain-containing protein n=1 Tax=Endocarpon pusillum TaxID=364733 RepID=A0A8H7E5V4_9EURO|nr:hypothetical protein GJ744_007628 [Endocarpon pusillum]